MTHIPNVNGAQSAAGVRAVKTLGTVYGANVAIRILARMWKTCAQVLLTFELSAPKSS